MKVGFNLKPYLYIATVFVLYFDYSHQYNIYRWVAIADKVKWSKMNYMNML